MWICKGECMKKGNVSLNWKEMEGKKASNILRGNGAYVFLFELK